MKTIHVLILIFCLVGCKDKNGLPSDILKPDKMQQVFWNIVQAESFTTKFIVKDPLKNAGIENAKMQQQIFAINKVSKDQFYNSYTYYTAHVELMRALLDSITSIAEREKYTILYSKPTVIKPERISLMPLRPMVPLPVIPMPIPTILPVHGVLDEPPYTSPVKDTTPVKTMVVQPKSTKIPVL